MDGLTAFKFFTIKIYTKSIKFYQYFTFLSQFEGYCGHTSYEWRRNVLVEAGFGQFHFKADGPLTSLP